MLCTGIRAIFILHTKAGAAISEMKMNRALEITHRRAPITPHSVFLGMYVRIRLGSVN